MRPEAPDPHLRCSGCGLEPDWDPMLVGCPACAGPLEAYAPLPELGGGLAPIIDPAERGVWRYRAALAVPHDQPVASLGEGATPLVRLARWGRVHDLDMVFTKLEFLSPTGSFKDRGASVVVSVLHAAGAKLLVEDSSGNAGAAVAAYGARAGLEVRVFVPSAAPAAKIDQISRYGAAIERVGGTREDVAAAAVAAVRGPGAVYASHSRHPMFVEGMKTFALELVEAGAEQLPQHLVIPVGNGGLLLGTYKAISELRAAGLEVAMPRLHLAQAAACAPLVEALERGEERPVKLTAKPTRAGGVAVAEPVRGRQILAAVRASGGSAVRVSEDEIGASQAELARMEGLYVEPTAALGFVAAARLRTDGIIGAGERVLIPATGSGLKDPAG